ncbi:ABC transporter substrate-binding protein [Acidisoma cladoniae]|uniref:ABC transporter substrate-binding protein n=1 Tax=Acidisoma cladoniae TaxID=3040935 RepID=UPI00254CF335|nr:ABC transporter substrate-binding protein [Acidisoma sp. PAMC 29798]
MLRKFGLIVALLLGVAPLASGAARADDKLTVLLDWFVNPDHAPLFVAQYIGAYKAEGLDVKFIAPADPSMPPRQIAAGQGDIALSYQAQLSLLAAQGLPVIRIGTLIDMPLNTLTATSTTGIKTMADFKGKKIGFSVSGVEDAEVGAMLEHAGLKLSDVTMVNVNFALVTALMSHQVDGVIGAYRNFEVNELKEKGFTPVVFYPEENGLPMNDELILIANKKNVNDPRIERFLSAVQIGTRYLIDHPQEMWDRFAKDHPDLNNDLNKKAWFQTIPMFAKNPFLLDEYRYKTYETFMFKSHLVDKDLPLADYATQIEQK